MKQLIALVAVSLSAVGMHAALPQPDLLAQIHFAGAQKISADAHALAFTNEFSSPEALAVRSQTADKLSVWLAGWLQLNLNVAVAGGAAHLRPLFDDLQKSEWFLEARAAAGKPEVALAIRLDPARAALWQSSLKLFFAAASFKSAGGWLIFDSNPGLLKLGDRLAQRISAPPAGWLDLDLNWPALAQWQPAFKSLALPETQFTLTAPDDNLRINGKFFFPENLALNLEPWRVPTNTLHEPFNSFTAVRGFASWFRSQPWAQPYQISPVPNQLFTWSLPSYAFQAFAAIPVPDAANALTQAYSRVAPVLTSANAINTFISPVTPDLTNNLITFAGLPFIAPYLKAVHEPAGQFLFWETFPNTPRSKPLPPELFQSLAKPNLVYYHWEITATRMPQLLQMSQFGLMVTVHKQLDSRSASFKWLQRFEGTLGNNTTEITQSGPAEFTFVRKTPGLFTAPELYTLANWLEATNFPGCNLKLQPLHRFRRGNQPANQPHVISLPAPGQAH